MHHSCIALVEAVVDQAFDCTQDSLDTVENTLDSVADSRDTTVEADSFAMAVLAVDKHLPHHCCWVEFDAGAALERPVDLDKVLVVVVLEPAEYQQLVVAIVVVDLERDCCNWRHQLLQVERKQLVVGLELEHC